MHFNCIWISLPTKFHHGGIQKQHGTLAIDREVRVYFARLFIDSHAPVVPRVLRVFAWLELNGLKPLRTERSFSETGMWLTLVFAERADAQALAEKFEGEVVPGALPA